MKFIKNSFLFFVFLFIGKTGLSQEVIDSTDYYVAKLKQIKSSDDLIKTYQFFQKDFKRELKEGNIKRAVFCLNKISSIEREVGFYNESEITAVKAIELINTQKSNPYYKRYTNVFNNRLGILYKVQLNISEALKLYNNCLVFAETAKDSMTIYNNISNVFKENKQFAKAEVELLKANKLFDRVNDNQEIARVLDNLGFIYFKLNNPNGLKLMEKALEIRKQSENSSGLYPSYNHLSNYYKDKNDLSKAREFALKAYDIAKSINSASLLEDVLKLRLDLEDSSVIKEYRILSDSLSIARQQNQNKFALLKYNVNQSKLNTQEEKIKKQQFKFITALISVFGILLFFLLKSRHKKEKLLQVYNTETRISKKVHDEVANDVYQVMTKLQDNINVKEDVLDDLESIYTKTRDISKENSAIDVNLGFESVLADLLVSYKSNQVNVITKGVSEIDWKSVPELKKTAIYRVLQELMTNMKKHSQANVVVLVFNQKSKKLTIEYNDNGVGSDMKKLNGLQNAENRILSLNGTITFESIINKGFKANIIV